VDIKAGLRT